MKTAIRNVRILDARKEIRGDVLIEGDRIAEVGRVGKADREIDGAGRAVIPGLINTHTHAAMTLLRGYGGDMGLEDWLAKKIWPLERHLTEDDVYHGTRLACAEMLTTGTTAFNDMYYFPESVARAAEEMGIRAAVSAVFFDKVEGKPPEEILARIERALAALRRFPNVIPAVGPHAPYTCSFELLREAAKIAEREGVPLHFHLAETEQETAGAGRPLVEALDEIGFLSPRLIAAHSIWLQEADIRRLAARGVNVSHCPASNMKLASGRSKDGRPRAFPWRALHAAGVNVALGTDGAASNNSLDMFGAMKEAALLQKHAEADPTAAPAREVFAAATVNGARALGLRAGLIEPGYLADLVLIDLERPYFCPGHDLLADLVYAARGDCVDTVLVGGRVVVERGRVPGQARILEEARQAARRLVEKA